MWADLVRELEESGGVLRVKVEDLRDGSGHERVGKHIRAEITRTLDDLGIGHLPAELPNRSTAHVVLYRRSSPAGCLIEAVRSEHTHPGAVERLRAVNTVPAPGSVVDREDVAAALRPLLDLMGEQ